MSENPKKCKPFPWHCHACGEDEVRRRPTRYTETVKHDGRSYEITVEDLEIPTCESCGERVFDNFVDERMSAALRARLGLLSPEEIRNHLRAVGLSQKQAASELGIAEATFSRWVTGTVIQSRSLDNLLRVFFGIPEVRQMLCRREEKVETS